MDLIFFHARMKINAAYSREVLLTQKLQHVMREIRGKFFIFQQDNAPARAAHQARQSNFWNETPSFIPTELLSPNSTDLNQVDYKIWGEM